MIAQSALQRPVSQVNGAAAGASIHGATADPSAQSMDAGAGTRAAICWPWPVRVKTKGIMGTNGRNGRLAVLLRIKLADGSTRRLVSASGLEDHSSGRGADRVARTPASMTQRLETQPIARRRAHAGHDPLAGAPWKPAMQLRSAFAVSKPIKRARLYVTALGAYEARLNGRKVGDALLAPESSDFRKHVLYRTYDVADMLATWATTRLGLMVGDGWYASAQIFFGRYAYGPSPRPSCIAQLEIGLRRRDPPRWSPRDAGLEDRRRPHPQQRTLRWPEVYDARQAKRPAGTGLASTHQAGKTTAAASRPAVRLDAEKTLPRRSASPRP